MYRICYTEIMPKRPNNQTHIRCNTCKNDTQCIEPVDIRKESGNRFHFNAVCIICNKFKVKYLNLEQVKALTVEIQDSDDGSIFTNTIIRNDEVLPIIPLIGPIAMGISALPSTDSIADNIEELKNTIIKNGNNLQTGLFNPDQSLRLIVPFIIAFLPEIIKTIPEAAIQIRYLNNGEENKLDPSLFDMDLFIEKTSTISDDEISSRTTF